MRHFTGEAVLAEGIDEGVDDAQGRNAKLVTTASMLKQEISQKCVWPHRFTKARGDVLGVCRMHGTLVVVPKAIVLSMTTGATQPVMSFNCLVQPLRGANLITWMVDASRHGPAARPAFGKRREGTCHAVFAGGALVARRLTSPPHQVGTLDCVESSM